MGYGVYFDWQQGRWAGYGVPAVCDWPDCEERVDRGLGFKCEEHYWPIPDQWLNDDPEPFETEGCGLFFCENHRYETDGHDKLEPKGESEEWLRHILTDESWKQWRTENPVNTLNYARRIDWGFSSLADIPIIDRWENPRGTFYLFEGRIIAHPFDSLMLLEPKNSIERLDLVLEAIKREINRSAERAIAKLEKETTDV